MTGLRRAGGLVALLTLGACSTHDFGADVSAEDLREAFDRTGLEICAEEDLDWDIAGFVAGRALQVSGDCTTFDPDDSRFQIVVGEFDSRTDRNHALQAATTWIRPLNNASAWTYGPYLIVLEGEKDRSDYDAAVDALEDLGAK